MQKKLGMEMENRMLNIIELFFCSTVKWLYFLGDLTLVLFHQQQIPIYEHYKSIEQYIIHFISTIELEMCDCVRAYSMR